MGFTVQTLLYGCKADQTRNLNVIWTLKKNA